VNEFYLSATCTAFSAPSAFFDARQTDTAMRSRFAVHRNKIATDV
jgi:hypothetical protein